MRRNYFEETPVRAPQLLADLTDLPQVLEALAGKGKPYDPLIKELLTIGDEVKIPTSKELQQKLGVVPGQFKKWLRTLFEDFKEALATDPDLIQITDTICELYLYGYQNYASVQCRLPVIPRVGERVDFPFLGQYTRCVSGYVSEVTYTLIKTVLYVGIKVEAGSYNRYYYWAKDRLDLEGKIDIRELLQLSKYDLKKRIYEEYGKRHF